jgi:protein-S-isoprenylcysteine O-methyltransferase Ste14
MPKWSTAWLWLSNLALGGLFLQFAYVNLCFLQVSPQLSTIIQLAFCTLAALLLMGRSTPKSESRSLLEWFSAIGGTFCMLLLRPVAGHDHSLLTAIQLAGTCFSFAGLLCLGRSFGIVPANRGVRSKGLYRLVRHPMYAGYVVSFTCYLLQNPSLTNTVLLITFLAFKVLRITMEEAHLSQDPAYAAMMQRVPYRIIPWVW